MFSFSWWYCSLTRLSLGEEQLVTCCRMTEMKRKGWTRSKDEKNDCFTPTGNTSRTDRQSIEGTRPIWDPQLIQHSPICDNNPFISNNPKWPSSHQLSRSTLIIPLTWFVLESLAWLAFGWLSSLITLITFRIQCTCACRFTLMDNLKIWSWTKIHRFVCPLGIATSADKICHVCCATGKFFAYLCHAFLPSQCGELHFHRIRSQHMFAITFFLILHFKLIDH